MLPERFFAVIWLATVIGGALISVGTEMSRRNQARNIEPLVRNMLRLSVRQSAAALAADGKARLRCMQDRDEDAPLHAPAPCPVVFDDRGRIVNAAGVDGDRRSFATWAHAGVSGRARRSGRIEMETAGDTLLAALAVEGAGGEQYVIVAGSPAATRLVGASLPEMFFRLIAIMFLAGVALLAASRYARSSLVTMCDATRRLAAGDLSARVPSRFTARSDDLGTLAREFNRMADRMATVLTTQREMLRDISHELRSPLSRLLIAVELARKNRALQTLSSLARIEAEVLRMNELIGDLLTYSSMRGTHDRSLDGDVNVQELLLGVVADARYEADAKPCSVTLAGLQECSVVGCEELLRSAFENVVRNAIKYNAAHAVVDITLRRSDELVELVVSDHGPGVPARDLERIFEPFYRVDNARQRSTGGTGLGLPIARQVVQAHGGTIHANNNPGGGLAITINLPLPPRRGGVVIPG